MRNKLAIRAVEQFACVTVLLLFPGFFFYQAGVALNVIPQFLGEFWGQMLIILGTPLLFGQVLLFAHRINRLTTIDSFLLVMTSYMVVWALLNFVAGGDLQRDPSYLFYCVECVCFWLVLHVAFRNLRLDGVWFARSLWICIVAIFVVVASHLQGHFFNTASLVDADVRIATYQGFGRSAFVVCVLLLSMSSGKRGLLVMFLGIVLLFLIGARAEFVGFLFVSCAIMIAREGLSKTAFVWGPVLVVGLIAVASSADVLEGNSRMLLLLKIGSKDVDQNRIADTWRAWHTIRSSIVFGDYASDLEGVGSGNYAHNALSVWVTYGLGGFLMYSWLLLYSVWASIRMLVKCSGTKPPLLIAAFGFSIYSLLEAIIAKSVFDPIFAVSWGLLVAAKVTSRKPSDVGGAEYRGRHDAGAGSRLGRAT